jgi:alcohol/geraniol dehydrogenase (NADP+)
MITHASTRHLLKKQTIRAYAALSRGAPLTPFEYSPDPLGAEQVEIAVSHCGFCHSDLSMIDDAWGYSAFPLVPGHEIVGAIAAVGPQVKFLQVGQRVGLGWQSASCMVCPQCRSGDHNLCLDQERTIVHRHGGFADRVRCHWSFALRLPATLKLETSGPLFCAGITVFNAMVQFGVKPPHRVGVIGIGGLGHLALQFLNKWGCEVHAFTSSGAKRDEVQRLGAHQVVDSRDTVAMTKTSSSLDLIVSIVDVPVDWTAILNSLRPKGRLVILGIPLEPIPVAVAQLLPQQRAVAGTTGGSLSTLTAMLDFCARHDIAPITQVFPLSRVNDALNHLRSGKARYRIVLKNDL